MYVAGKAASGAAKAGSKVGKELGEFGKDVANKGAAVGGFAAGAGSRAAGALKVRHRKTNARLKSSRQGLTRSKRKPGRKQKTKNQPIMK